MYISGAVFEDPTGTSADGQRDGSQEVPASRIEGDETCIIDAGEEDRNVLDECFPSHF